MMNVMMNVCNECNDEKIMNVILNLFKRGTDSESM